MIFHCRAQQFRPALANIKIKFFSLYYLRTALIGLAVISEEVSTLCRFFFVNAFHLNVFNQVRGASASANSKMFLLLASAGCSVLSILQGFVTKVQESGDGRTGRVGVDQLAKIGCSTMSSSALIMVL